MVDADPPSPLVTRRTLLAGGAAAVGLALVGCSSDDEAAPTPGRPDPTTTGAGGADGPDGDATSTTGDASSTTGGEPDGSEGTPTTTAFTAADFAALAACTALPEQTAGPFPSRELLERRDVTEGLTGRPLRLGVQVVDARCRPVPDVVVEIWHCDVDGDYSGYPDGATGDDAGEGTTFLRGTQRANAEGIVEFHTVYPGWYRGRAVHVHARLHVDDELVATSQFYFDDDVSREVFAAEPYLGDQDTTNDDDGIAGDPGAEGTLLTVSDDAELDGSRGLIVVGLPA